MYLGLVLFPLLFPQFLTQVSSYQSYTADRDYISMFVLNILLLKEVMPFQSPRE
jgi:ABC-type transport system involved in cytochrome c biogenesis permease component